jgi:hypothetical protein
MLLNIMECNPGDALIHQVPEPAEFGRAENTDVRNSILPDTLRELSFFSMR